MFGPLSFESVPTPLYGMWQVQIRLSSAMNNVTPGNKWKWLLQSEALFRFVQGSLGDRCCYQVITELLPGDNYFSVH